MLLIYKVLFVGRVDERTLRIGNKLPNNIADLSSLCVCFSKELQAKKERKLSKFFCMFVKN